LLVHSQRQGRNAILECWNFDLVVAEKIVRRRPIVQFDVVRGLARQVFQEAEE
jgi:hypothetical protein